jgi:hypothetical protein
MTNEFTVKLTFADLKQVSDIVHNAWLQEGYSARQSDEDVADTVDEETGETKDRSWARNGRKRAIARRDELSNLHYRLTGGYLTEES